MFADLNKADAERAKKDDAAGRDVAKRGDAAGLMGMQSKDRQLMEMLTGADKVREFQMRLAPAGDAARATTAMHGQEFSENMGYRSAENDKANLNLDNQVTRINASPTLTQDEKSQQLAALDDERANLKKAYDDETVELIQQRNLQRAEDDARIRSTTLMGGANDALAEFTRSTTDAGAVMKQWFGGALNTTNDAIIKTLTEHNTAGQHIFGQAGKEIFTSAAGDLLRGAEGNLLKGLGIGGKADGASEATALWVRMTGSHGLTGANPLSKAIGGWLGLPGTTDGAGTIGDDDSSAVRARWDIRWRRRKWLAVAAALGGILGKLLGGIFWREGGSGSGSSSDDTGGLSGVARAEVSLPPSEAGLFRARARRWGSWATCSAIFRGSRRGRTSRRAG